MDDGADTDDRAVEAEADDRTALVESADEAELVSLEREQLEHHSTVRERAS